MASGFLARLRVEKQRAGVSTKGYNTGRAIALVCMLVFLVLRIVRVGYEFMQVSGEAAGVGTLNVFMALLSVVIAVVFFFAVVVLGMRQVVNLIMLGGVISIATKFTLPLQVLTGRVANTAAVLTTADMLAQLLLPAAMLMVNACLVYFDTTEDMVSRLR